MRGGRPVDADVLQLPAVVHGAVGEEDIDVNQHMNVNVYLRILTTSTIDGLAPAGLGHDYPRTRGRGLFSVDHHAQYLSELRLGASYSVHVRLLAASDRGVHTIAYLRDATGARVAATLESLLLNVDHETRRVSAIPDDLHPGVAAFAARHAALPWRAVTCGAIALPGRAL